MSDIYFQYEQVKQNDVFEEVIIRLEGFKQQLVLKQKWDNYYKQIGFSREQILEGLNLINIFFKETHKQVRERNIPYEIGKDFFERVTEFLLHENYQQLSQFDKAIYVLQIQTKIGTSLKTFNTLPQMIQRKSIINSEKQHYQHIWDKIQFVEQSNKDKIKQKYKWVKKITTMATSAILVQNQFQWLFMKKIFFGLSYTKFLFNYSSVKLKCLSFYKYPTLKLAKEIWNIPDNGAIKQLYKFSWDAVEFNEKIFIPAKAHSDHQFPNIFVPSQDCIQVRILNHKQLYFKNKIMKGCCDLTKKNKDKVKKTFDTIIIHMHGGGFIALSSRTMQCITRKWANELQIPIFSIDYRKPPEHPFPQAVNDCLTVYNFIINKISHYMNVQPKHIYLAGDSAGANLACSLVIKILINQLPIPKGIYLAYPPLDIRSIYTPSKVNSLTDPLIWPSMLLLIQNQYLNGQYQLLQSPLVCPLLLTQSFIRKSININQNNNNQNDNNNKQNDNDKKFPSKWPKTFISVGKKDTFYDDSIMFMQKLIQVGVECYCRVYEQFSHGYLSTTIMMSQCQFTLDDSVKDLKKLMSQ